MNREPALDPFEERLAVDQLGEALVLRPRMEGPLVLTRADVARLRDALGPDSEDSPVFAETLRRPLKADSGEAAKAAACGSRRATRTPKRNARRRRANRKANS